MNGMAGVMGTAEQWTSDLVTPLNNILRGLPKYSSNRISSFAQRIRDVCKLNFEFTNCVNRCGDRVAARILLKGQTSWASICDAYHYNTGDFMSFVVPCWSRYGDEVVALCTTQATVLQNAASSLVDSGINMITDHLLDLC
ncbi:unnamed protein product, partial [Gongylonema pulchrum]|uniref:Helitron_like_N domain-containing protein n=1 Tax=Gongylonema pulchrum TaxID=637853 RepID=A0A183DWK0_9BILA